jgi:hypothetical protein
MLTTDNLLYPLRTRLTMSTIQIDFEWTRAFAKTAGEPAYAIEGGKIRQIGRGKQRYSPLISNNSLFLDFAQLDGSPASCLSFAEKRGLLVEPASISNPPSEDLSFWRAEIKKMFSLVRMLPTVIRVVNSRGTYARVGKLNVLLVPGTGPDARPVMVMEPENLLQAMNLQLAQSVAGGAALIPCQQCGRWFEAGHGAKRTVAKFCTDSCRNRFHYERASR